MDPRIQSQINRAKKLLEELETNYDIDLRAKKVSETTENLAQEVLLKMRHIFDQVMYKFFEKNYLSTCPNPQTVRIYFPILKKKSDLDSMLGRAGMTKMKDDFPDFYTYLDSVQPYHQDNEWLGHLAELASEKHIRLTPQIIKGNKELRLSSGGATAKIREGGSIWIGNGVTFRIGNMVLANDQLVDVNNPAKFYGEGRQELMVWNSLLFENKNIDVKWLCKKVVLDGEQLVEKILSFLQ